MRHRESTPQGEASLFFINIMLYALLVVSDYFKYIHMFGKKAGNFKNLLNSVTAFLLHISIHIRILILTSYETEFNCQGSAASIS